MVFSGARFLVSRTCRALGGPLESLNGIGMKSLRTCFFSSSVFDQPKTSRHHCFSSVRFLARKICGAIVFSVALLALELQFSLAFFWCLMFLFFCWKLLVFFHFGFLAVGTKSSCSIRSCQAKHKKTSGFDSFLGRTRYCKLWRRVAAYSLFRFTLDNRRWSYTIKHSNFLNSDFWKFAHLHSVWWN